MRCLLTQPGSSIGANYREANRAVSHADFINKIGICAREASETQHWLDVAVEAELLSADRAREERQEYGELLAVFTSIGRSGRGWRR